jgi:membrane-bound serine protease (ClpP class)
VTVYRILALALALMAGLGAPAYSAPSDRVMVVTVDGAISVAAARVIAKAIDEGKKTVATAIVMQLDTPGGLVSATRDIIREMIASPVPIIVYVAPSGARAASAGTFIVYASHAAAMAPGTNLGAATPVQFGGLPGVPQPKDDKKPTEPSAVEKKAINDTVALLRSLGQLRGRDIDFAEKAVHEAATLTADEAKKRGVVEYVATSVNDLLAQADGRTVTADGRERVLATKDAAVTVIEPDWRTKFLAVIANPNVAFVLFLIGVYGILFEFWSPGVFFPGVIGGICLILAFISLSLLPVEYGALGLLVLGVALMIGEAFTPGIGALGIGGLIAFLIGAFFLIDPEGSTTEMRVSIPVIVGAAIACAGLSFGVLGAAMRARQRPATSNAEELLKSKGVVIDWQDRHDDIGSGRIRIQGEIWNARAERNLRPGDRVRIVSRDGLTLTVELE